jgi:hypothetical protein
LFFGRVGTIQLFGPSDRKRLLKIFVLSRNGLRASNRQTEFFFFFFFFTSGDELTCLVKKSSCCSIHIAR